MRRQGQRQPVDVVVDQVELRRAGEGVADVHGLPDPAVPGAVLRVPRGRDPVEVGDQTLIPVSLGWFGFGGGGDDENGGGGGGGASIPVGAYIRRPGKDLEFEPNLISLVAVSIPLVWVTGTVLRKLVRVLKK